MNKKLKARSRVILGELIPSSWFEYLAEKWYSKTIPTWQREHEAECGEKTAKLGFVGAGAFAQHHLDVLSSIQDAEISAICTTGGPRGAEAARKYGIPRTVSRIEDLVAMADLDAFVVNVPILATKDVVMKCLATGKPVLLEKPAGLTSREAEEMAQQAESHGTFGMVAMNRRFFSVVEHGLAALANCGRIRGAILEVPEVITARRLSKAQPEVIYDHWMVCQSLHAIDLLLAIIGRPVEVKTLSIPNSKLDNAGASFSCLIKSEDEMIGSIVALWDTSPRWRLRIIAENGSLEFCPLHRGWFTNASGYRMAIKPDPVDDKYRCGLYAQDRHFVRAVRKGKKPAMPACMLRDAVVAHQVIEQMISGVDQKGS